MSFVSKWFGFGRDERYDRGVRAYEAGNVEEAIQELLPVAEGASDPSTARLARYYLSESYAKLGMAALTSEEFANAHTAFLKAIDLHPHYPDLHLKLASAYKGLGDREKQQAALARALQINPNYAEAILSRGIFLYEEAAYDEALAEIQRAIEIEPGLNGERYAFAVECHQRGDTARALANFLAMSSSDSQDANAHARVAASFVKQGLFQEAAQEYGRALEIAPRYADLRCRLGEVMLELDLVSAAEHEFRQALEINPRYAAAWAYLGISLRRLKRADEAKECFDQALALDPHNLVAQAEILRR
ncbi:MAG: tetratricopeptide repeat protein [Fimbriimonadaceae bacterium]|nr:tetratricopeptide repeat protein [Fimbriimonadaceae bacterium]